MYMYIYIYISSDHTHDLDATSSSDIPGVFTPSIPNNVDGDIYQYPTHLKREIDEPCITDCNKSHISKIMNCTTVLWGISLPVFPILCLSKSHGPHLDNFLLLVDGSISFIQFMHSASGMPFLQVGVTGGGFL